MPKLIHRSLMFVPVFLVASCGGGPESATPTAPAFAVQPASITIPQSTPATFTATVTGEPMPALQWQISVDDGATFTNITGATASSYSTPATAYSDSGHQYRVIAKNDSGMLSSDEVTLLVGPAAPVNFTMTPQAVKVFKFDWTDVADETEYRLLENIDGKSSFVPVATIAADSESYEHYVYLPSRVNAQYILQSCRSGACVNSETVQANNLINAVGYFKASNPQTNHNFGSTISLSEDGNTMVVGAAGDDSASTNSNGDQYNISTALGAIGTNSGAVYIYKRDAASHLWVQTTYLKADTLLDNRLFGYSVSLSSDGQMLAVGAPGDKSRGSGINPVEEGGEPLKGSGAVYVYTRSGDTWTQEVRIKSDDQTFADYYGDALGVSVKLSADGSVLAVGASAEDSGVAGINGDISDNTLEDSGAVFIYVRDSEHVWTREAYLKASNPEAFDEFGREISISGGGDILAVGVKTKASASPDAIGDVNDTSLAESGAVYVFERNANKEWSQRAYIKGSNPMDHDWFGISVSLSRDGKALAVGSPQEDDRSIGVNSELSYEYRSDGEMYRLDQGAAYVFVRDDELGWVRQARIKTKEINKIINFGWSVSISDKGNTLVVGATGESSDTPGITDKKDSMSSQDVWVARVFSSGAGLTFARDDNGLWAQQALFKGLAVGQSDYTGSNVEISGDGKTIAMTQAKEDSAASGIGGDHTDNSLIDSGAVLLY